MTILIAAYANDQKITACDERCYGAITNRCHCICGGINHGVGEEKAIVNTREHYKEWIREYTQGEEGLYEFEVPALYSLHTPTARKIGRLINTAYRNNRIDVYVSGIRTGKREGKVKGKTRWVYLVSLSDGGLLQFTDFADAETKFANGIPSVQMLMSEEFL